MVRIGYSGHLGHLSERLMSTFRPIDRGTSYLLPPSVEEWLPERHLARFVVDTVEQMDLSQMTQTYRGSGTVAYHPAMLLGLLIYGYATGEYSSRKIERATYDSVAFRFIAANQHPDHDTLAVFRQRFLPQIEGLFVQVLQVAQTLGLLKLGTIALDGTKIKANASKHNAYSHGHTLKLEEQLTREVRELLLLAEQADNVPIPDSLDIPQELSLREARLAAIREARAQIEARAAQRLAEERQGYERKLAARQERTGKKQGRPPDPPTAGGPDARDQVNLTDPDSRIMKCAGNLFEQAYNAQAAVATDTHLIVGARLSDAGADARQLEPMLQELQKLPAGFGKAETLLADTGFFSLNNLEACERAKLVPLIALHRQDHHRHWSERHREAPPLVEGADALARMRHRLSSPEGRAMYALRKCTPEPVFGIIKSVMRFRQFSLRGLQKVQGEWKLVAMSWNVKRMFALAT
jgi:transposase